MNFNCLLHALVLIQHLVLQQGCYGTQGPLCTVHLLLAAMGFWSGSWMVMECSWTVNSMAILRGEKRSEKTRVEQPYSPWDFNMAIYSGEHNRERGGKDVLETKDASPSSSSSPSHCRKATTVPRQEVKERENVLLRTTMIGWTVS